MRRKILASMAFTLFVIYSCGLPNEHIGSKPDKDELGPQISESDNDIRPGDEGSEALKIPEIYYNYNGDPEEKCVIDGDEERATKYWDIKKQELFQSMCLEQGFTINKCSGKSRCSGKIKFSCEVPSPAFALVPSSEIPFQISGDVKSLVWDKCLTHWKLEIKGQPLELFASPETFSSFQHPEKAMLGETIVLTAVTIGDEWGSITKIKTIEIVPKMGH